MFFEWLNDEDAPPFRKRAMQRLVDENDAKQNLIVTSVVTDIELLPDKIAHEKERKYSEKFDGDRMYQHQIDPNVIRLAREIRNYYFRDNNHPSGFAMMDLGDSIHLATAIILNVDEFHTRDNKSNKGKVPLVSLYDWSGDTKVCGRYDLIIASPEDKQTNLVDVWGPSSDDE